MPEPHCTLRDLLDLFREIRALFVAAGHVPDGPGASARSRFRRLFVSSWQVLARTLLRLRPPSPGQVVVPIEMELIRSAEYEAAVEEACRELAVAGGEPAEVELPRLLLAAWIEQDWPPERLAKLAELLVYSEGHARGLWRAAQQPPDPPDRVRPEQVQLMLLTRWPDRVTVRVALLDAFLDSPFDGEWDGPAEFDTAGILLHLDVMFEKLVGKFSEEGLPKPGELATCPVPELLEPRHVAEFLQDVNRAVEARPDPERHVHRFLSAVCAAVLQRSAAQLQELRDRRRREWQARNPSGGFAYS